MMNHKWTADHNDRRCELLDRKAAGTITNDEQIELCQLHSQAEAYFDEIAPPPLEGAQRLLAQLLRRRHVER